MVRNEELWDRKFRERANLLYDSTLDSAGLDDQRSHSEIGDLLFQGFSKLEDLFVEIYLQPFQTSEAPTSDDHDWLLRKLHCVFHEQFSRATELLCYLAGNLFATDIVLSKDGQSESPIFEKKCLEMKDRLEQRIDMFFNERKRDSIETGAGLVELGRTYLDYSMKSESEEDVSKARDAARDAEEILSRHPGTSELAELWILQADILRTPSLESEEDSQRRMDLYNKAKLEIPAEARLTSPVFAKACEHLGRFYAAKRLRDEAGTELQRAADIYRRLGQTKLADGCQFVLLRLEAERKGHGAVFKGFAASMKDREEDPEVRVLVWQRHLQLTRAKSVARRSDDSATPQKSYWLSLLKEVREDLKRKSRLF